MKPHRILLEIWSLLRRRGAARSLKILRELVATHGVLGAVQLLLGRVTNAGPSQTGSSPISRLVAANALFGRSASCFADQIVLIGSLDLPQCRKYRVIQKQEMIEQVAGKRVAISNYHDYYRWRTLLQSAGKLILYRVPNGLRFEEIMIEASRLQLPVCYDIDDAVFDLETVKSNPNLPHLSGRIRRALLQDATAFTGAMQQCDMITVSTPGLQRLVNRQFSDIPCYVMPNGIDAETIHYGAVARQMAAAAPGKHFRIVLTSGSLAHAADTEVATDGIRLFLERCPDAQLINIGHFDAGNPLRHHKALKEFPFLPYSEYLRVLATADCTIVPLATSVFNEGKSIVRLIDATEVGVPVIASPVGEYAEPTLSAAFVAARSAEEWCRALEALAASRRETSSTVEAAKEHVRAPRLLHALWQKLDPQLRAFLGAHTSHSTRSLVENAQAL
jgi:glycosyltransferase involved in cell wall biosynthesis